MKRSWLPPMPTSTGATSDARMGMGRAHLADYNKALELDPRHYRAYMNRGNLRSDQGDYDAAIADYTKAIEVSDNPAMAYLNRGSARGKKGDNQAADADYDKALEVSRSLPQDTRQDLEETIKENKRKRAEKP